MQAAVLPEEIRWLLQDCEDFLAEGLRNENLSAVAKDHRDHILRGLQQVKTRYCWDFPPPGDPGEHYPGQSSSDDTQSGTQGPFFTSDASFLPDYQEEGMEDMARGAQELDNIIKQGYLEKKSKDHSFFGSEWQKRWCVVSRGLFYYYANEKSKQPKGTFVIKGYSIRMAPHLRRDSKKESCFELTSQDRRSYEFTATNPAEARDWVDQISFLLKDLSSLTIPYEEEEEEEIEEETYDDIDGIDSLDSGSQGRPVVSAESLGQKEPREEKEEDIYEVMPGEKCHLLIVFLRHFWNWERTRTLKIDEEIKFLKERIEDKLQSHFSPLLCEQDESIRTLSAMLWKVIYYYVDKVQGLEK